MTSMVMLHVVLQLSPCMRSNPQLVHTATLIHLSKHRVNWRQITPFLLPQWSNYGWKEAAIPVSLVSLHEVKLPFCCILRLAGPLVSLYPPALQGPTALQGPATLQSPTSRASRGFCPAPPPPPAPPVEEVWLIRRRRHTGGCENTVFTLI